MPTITAQELSEQDPKRFREEYSKWTEYNLDYDWWDYIEERLKEQLEPAGVHDIKLHFRLSYSQGDYATFEGRIDVHKWMDVTKDGPDTEDTPTYAEKYPALRLAMEDYGDYASVTTYHRSCGARVSMDGGCVGNTYASGIFAGLESDAWDELIADQYDEAGLEQALQGYVDALSHQLYRDLRDEYEHLNSEQSFIESCECNDVTFEIEEECEA
jgi:hypothetical protein